MSEEDHAVNERDIAVIGMSGAFPGASDLEAFWSNLRDGVEGITFFSDDELKAAGVAESLIKDPRYVKAGSLLDGIEDFDAEFFGYTAREAEILDPQQRLFLEHAWTALENAAIDPGRYEGLIGVYAGVAWNTYLLSNLVRHGELFEGGGAFQVFITNDKDFMPTRASYKLDLRGPSVILQTSCSTSLVAVHLACLSLLNFECDAALVGGVTVKVPQEAGYYYLDGGLASPDGHCRAFDAGAAGTIFGSGVGVVVLKRLAEALEDGDPIRAVIRGSAVNNDGSAKVSYTAPSVEGQAEVVAAAQAVAGIDPRTVQYVEAHGTGTSLGDPIEVTALTKVFRESTEDKGFCGLGSVKTNVGHLDAAAGIAGFIKTVLALEHEQLPPSLNFESPNPAIDFESSPFYVNAKLQKWPRGEEPRRAGVSSFGVGGTNAHVLLEEAPPAPAPAADGQAGDQLLVLSARSEKALEEATDRLAEVLADPDGPSLEDVAYTLRTGRAVFRHRRALVAESRQEAARILAERDPQKLLNGVDREDPRDRPVVFLFSGQGSQYPGMGKALYEAEEVFRQEVDRCAELLEKPLGLDLREVMFAGEGDGEERAADLSQTRLTQPALFTVEYALAQLWKSWGVAPAALLGHSIGEYVAACLAGVFSLEDALTVVAARGSLMQDLPSGSMLAVPLAEEDLVSRISGDLSLAAINEPARCVVSGPEAAVAAFEESLSADGIQARQLHTSHAFHSAMMDPILDPFRAVLEKVTLNAPELPVVSNLSGSWLTAEEATDPGYWCRHLRETVRFAAGARLALEDPERVLLEVGPGRTLTTLASRHPERDGQPVIASLRHPQDEDQPLDGVLAALGRLWLAGLDLDPYLFFGEEPRRRVALPTYPFQRRRYWIEPAALPAAGASLPAASRDGSGTAKRPDLADWFSLPSWRPSLSPAASSAVSSTEVPGRWLIFADGAGLAPALMGRLEERGCEVMVVEAGEGFAERNGGYVLDPEEPEHYRRLLSELEEAGKSPEAIVHGWSLSGGGSPASDRAAFDRAQLLGFGSLLALVQALGRLPASPRHLLVVANEVLAVGPGEALRPEKAPMLGLLKVLPQEHPNLRCRFVDLSLPAAGGASLADRLLAELAAPEGDEVIAYRGRHRYLPDHEPVRLSAQGGAEGETGGDGVLRREGVYLLTGGLEGNGFAFAKLLARSGKPHLALVEAKEADGPAAERVEALTALGAEVEVFVADPWDSSGIAGAVARAVERFGDLHGVIHAAGTVGERTFRVLAETGPEEVSWHFRSKVDVVYGLERALEERAAAGHRLDFCVLLSSLASVLGGLAYGSYAAANCFLEAFVREHNRRGGVPWLALSWDVWRFEDEEEQITELRRDLAELAMSPAEGEEAFRRVLALDGADQILVSTGDLDGRLEQRRQRIAASRGKSRGAQEGEGRKRHPRPDLPTAHVPPASETERQLVAIWEGFLGFQGIGVEDNFFELGGDSFVAVQVVTRIKDELGVDLPVARLYQGLTVRSLAGLLEKDDEDAAEERAAKLEERRQSMDRRRAFQQRRRSGRKT